MIAIKLQGGLGNQMFQYAFGTALAKKFNEIVKFDTSSFDSNSFRTLDIKAFDIDLPELSQQEYSTFFSLKNRALKKLRLNNLISNKVHFEHSSEYYNVEHNPKISTFYFGYWQSPQYFENISSLIKKQYQVQSFSHPYSDIINNNGSVAIHIRKGDYLNPGNTDVYFNLQAEYYLRAVQQMEILVPNAKYLVFSDDMNWVINNLNLPVNWEPVIDAGLNSTQTLMLMSKCKHQIIANSTFSWWAAWLNNNPDKHIIAPDKWFANGLTTKSLIPSNWARI